MGNQTRGRKHTAASPDETAVELRLLIREAHEAMQGLTELIHTARLLTSSGESNAVDRLIETAVNVKMLELDKVLKAEGVRISAEMTQELVRSREWMMHNLELIRITETPEGLLAEFRTEQL